ncbi:MAG TPA: hypothetical protein VME42_07280 [Steroidobacteraceae bacterium]|nr:hypothetical protein [Steroidobacteraceae bacterium]
MIKAAEPRLIARYARRVRELSLEAPLAAFFDSIDLLVPVPASEPLAAPGAVLADRLAAALVDEGLARSASAVLRRIGAVPKSRNAAPGRRPTVERHYHSLAVERARAPADPARIVLVDDVVTKGRTLLAAAVRLQESFPRASIGAFALMRTLGFAADVPRLLAPCVGTIAWRGGDARRDP